MANDYYTAGSQTAFTKARASGINTQTDAVEAGFDLLPSLAEMRSANSSFIAASGTANAITLNHPIIAWSTYTGKDGHKINVQITTTNTSTVTMAVNGLAAKACKRNDGTALQSGDLVAAGFYDFIYDETAGYFVVTTMVNGFLEDVEDQVAIASSMTNFIGLWSAQTGAKTVPTAVYHLGAFWALTSNIADITAKVPGTATEWVLIDSGISYAGMTGAVSTPAVCIHGGYFWFLHTSSADITADVPGVSSKWEKVYLPSISGNALKVLRVNSGGTAVEWGAAVQSISAKYDSSFTTSSTSYVDTGLTASITPKSASSNVLVIFSVNRCVGTGGSGLGVIHRGATALTSQPYAFCVNGTATSQSFSFTDSPATTSATTYKLRAKTEGAGSIEMYLAGGVWGTLTLVEIP